MSSDTKNTLITHCAKFLENRLDFFDHLDTIGIIALAAAVGLLIIQGLAAIYALASTTGVRAALEARPRTQALPGFGEMVKALPTLVQALTKAPASVILIIMGLLLVWLPDFGPSEACLELAKPETQDQSMHDGNASETPTSTVTETTTKTTKNWKTTQ